MELEGKAKVMENNLGQVMLVDDDADQRMTLQMLLSGYEMEVVEAASGEVCLELLAEKTPNLILLDFDMPGIDGLTTLAKIREQHSQESLPVVMVSNRQDTDIVVEALDNGANDYVTKVTDPEILLARIRRHLIQRRLPNPADRPFGGKIGKYLLGQKLADGPIFSVFKATDEETKSPVGFVILKPGFRVNTELHEKLEHCSHELLANLLEVGAEPVDFLVYQWIEGPGLEEFLEGRELTKSEVLSTAIRIAEACAAIHATGRRHGELRPSTVRLDEQGTPQILEFGLAELLIKENSISRTGDVPGHPAYLAPEQLTQPDRVDFRADIYALGALIFALATSQHPFQGSMAEILNQVLHERAPRPSEIRKDGERAFDFVCSRLLSKKPEERYESCEALLQKLRELSEEA